MNLNLKQTLDEIKFRARQAYFLTPNYLQSEVNIAPKTLSLLDELKRNGIVKISGEFLQTTQHITNYYLPFLENFEVSNSFAELPTYILKHRSLEKIDRPYQAMLSFKDPAMESFYFNREILGLVYNYYKRQPYHRNHPYLIKSHFTGNNLPHNQCLFHKDGGLKQISLMLLLNDVGKNDTHMEYCLGSHTDWQKTSDFTNRKGIDQKKVESSYEIFKAVGKKGDLFLFDAGNGFHRAVYKKDTTRIILHMNLSTGSNLQPGRYDSRKDWDSIRQNPKFVFTSILKKAKN